MYICMEAIIRFAQFSKNDDTFNINVYSKSADSKINIEILFALTDDFPA